MQCNWNTPNFKITPTLCNWNVSPKFCEMLTQECKVIETEECNVIETHTTLMLDKLYEIETSHQSFTRC